MWHAWRNKTILVRKRQWKDKLRVPSCDGRTRSLNWSTGSGQGLPEVFYA